MENPPVVSPSISVQEMALAPLCLGKSDGWKQMDLEKYVISNLTNFLTLLVLWMVDNLQRYELGTIRHHIEICSH